MPQRSFLHSFRRKASNTAGRAAQIAKDKLQTVTKNEWDAAVRGGEEPWPLLRHLRELGVPLQVGSELSTALHDLIPDIVSSESYSTRARWFQASEWLSSGARNTLFRNLRDSLYPAATQAPDLAGLLRSGNVPFASILNEEADASVRHLLVVLLRNSDGRAWLQENLPRTLEWLSGAPSETRDFLDEQLLGLLTGASEEDRSVLQELGKAWGFSVPLEEEAS